MPYRIKRTVAATLEPRYDPVFADVHGVFNETLAFFLTIARRP
jgi:hypothetical protein